MGGGARGLPTRRLGYTGGVPKDTFFPTHRCNPHIQLTGEIISSICSIAERPTAAGILFRAFIASCSPGRYSAACQENFLPTHPGQRGSCHQVGGTQDRRLRLWVTTDWGRYRLGLLSVVLD